MFRNVCLSYVKPTIMGYILSIESDLAGNHQTIRIINHAEVMFKKGKKEQKTARQVLRFYVSATDGDREAKVMKDKR